MLNSPLAPQGNYSPLSLVVNLLLNLSAETNSTHDSIAKLLVQHRLEWVPVVLDNLKKSVNKGFLWRHIQRASSIRPRAQLLGERGLVDFEERREGCNVRGGGLCLAIEESCNSNFVAPDFLADGFEAEVLLGFGFEKGRG